VHRLVVNATERVWEIIADRAHAAEEQRSPRAERLWELEHHPPVWLVQRIGRPVATARRYESPSELRRAWRRAALALDDYRQAAGPDAFREMSANPPADASLRQLHARALHSIENVEHVRNTRRGIGREL
jgi:hypothetical protein